MTGMLYATPDIPIILVEKMQEQRCVVVAGSGVSIPPSGRVGPPGEAMLAADLARQLSGQLDDFTLPWVAQLYADSVTKGGATRLRTYVAGWLNDKRYQPTAIHHLIAQLPFPVMVYTAYDTLLQQALDRETKLVNRVLPDRPQLLGFTTGQDSRTVIQLYGTVDESLLHTLHLTEEERSQVLKNSELEDFFRGRRSDQYSLLFLGYYPDDPTFRQLYFYLRPDRRETEPSAYMVHPDPSRVVEDYWRERNLRVLDSTPSAFLEQLADRLGISIKQNHVLPEPLSDEDRSRRERVNSYLGQQFGIAVPAESGGELLPNSKGLAFLNRVMAEQYPIDEDRTPETSWQQGNAEWAEENYDQARQHFNDAIAQDPNFIDAYYSLHYLLVEMEDFSEALGIYRKLQARAKPEQLLLPSPPYAIKGILGKSDVGVTYQVEKEQSGSLAVTILRRALAREPERLELFQQEMKQRMAGLLSGRISRFLDWDRHLRREFIIYEYVAGQSLRDRMDSNANLPLSEVYEIFDQVAEALEDAHQQGMCHLDLEPANTVLTTGGVNLINFGFSRLVRQPDASATGRTESIVYRSPEQRAGEEGDERSDIYSLGTILYEMLAGHAPGLGPFQETSEQNPRIDQAIDILIASSRAINPIQRTQSISQMRQEFHRITQSWHSAWLNQGFRLVLYGISRLYDYPLVLIPLIAAVIVLFIVSESWGDIAHFQFGSRIALLLVLNSFVLSGVSYRMVYQAARTRGLGSLVHSGKGMGAVVGWLLVLYLVRVADWCELERQAGVTSGNSGGLAGVPLWNFVAYLLVVLMYSVLLTIFAFYVLRETDRLTAKLSRGSTWVFYGGFLAMCGLIAVAAQIDALKGMTGLGMPCVD